MISMHIAVDFEYEWFDPPATAGGTDRVQERFMVFGQSL
jgi:hypothetical protein